MKIKLFTIPNMLTLCNLLCGSMAVVECLVNQNLESAFYWVVACALFDFLDGMAARLLGSYSELGKQLDSLADMVSFGLVPGCVMYVIYAQSMGDMRLSPILFVITLCSALRLAKFNIDTEQSYSFKGLPTPAATIFVSSSGYLFAQGTFAINPYFVLAIAVCLALLLIGNREMFALKFKNFSFGDNALRYCFLALSGVGLVVFGVLALPFIIVLYILISFVCALFK